MPEGPEIRRAADRVHAALAGRVATRVRFGLEPLRRFEEELSGRRVLSVRPRGKAMLTRFEGGRVVYSHNQLYGKWMVCLPDRPPRTGRSLRVSIENEHRWGRLYSASDVDVLWEEELVEHPFLAKLGPDLLDEDTTPALVGRRLADERFRGRSLGALLLDQGFVAGLGNYLRSEVLFFGGLAPGLRPKDLEEGELALLARTIVGVTRRSYRHAGRTELKRLADAAKRAGEPRRLWRHAVFGRDREPCRRCGTAIEKLDVAARRLYLCPTCQPTSR